MRTKVFIWGTFLLLILGTIAYTETPHFVKVVRGVGINDILGQNDTTQVDSNQKGKEPFVTLFRDDFEGPNPHRTYHRNQDALHLGLESTNIRNGTLFLNLTKSPYPWNNAFLYVSYYQDGSIPGRRSERFRSDSLKWLYSSMEIRLRFADEDLGSSGLGEAMRAWGFCDGSHPTRVLELETWSQESDPHLAGFFAQSDNKSINWLNTKLDTVSFSEWHTYKILWEPGNVTFLVDDIVVATTDIAPKEPMALDIYIENKKRSGNQGRYWELDNADSYDLPNDVSIQIDYVRIFVRRGAFDEMDAHISTLISRVQNFSREMQTRGENTEEVEDALSTAISYWSEDIYVYLTAKTLLEAILPDN